MIIELTHLFVYSFPIQHLKVKCGALRDLVLFVQFKKREKQPWRSVNFSKVAGFSITNIKRYQRLPLLTALNE